MNTKLIGLMRDWKTLTKGLSECTEAEVFEMFEAEKSGRRRQAHLVRLHQRYMALRTARERMEFI